MLHFMCCTSFLAIGAVDANRRRSAPANRKNLKKQLMRPGSVHYFSISLELIFLRQNIFSFLFTRFMVSFGTKNLNPKTEYYCWNRKNIYFVAFCNRFTEGKQRVHSIKSPIGETRFERFEWSGICTASKAIFYIKCWQ